MSFRIHDLKFNNKSLLLSQDLFSSNNVFTLLTGKNGVGKTRILTSIVDYFIANQEQRDDEKSDKLAIFNSQTEAKISYSKNPEKIIVHTNSKYNKFPNYYSYNLPKNYYNIDESRFPSTHIHANSNFFSQLLLNSQLNTKAISDTLIYLKYNPYIRLSLELSWLTFPANYFNNTVQNNIEILNQIGFNTSQTAKKSSRKDKYFIAILYKITELIRVENITTNDLKIIYESISSFNIIDSVIDIDIELKNNYYKFNEINKKALKVFLKYNLLRFNSIYLNKDSSSEENSFFIHPQFVRFDNLSSGQQAILNTLLGISSVISDNSLICIDEPEISLHPEWQEDIIQKLQYVFQDIQGCHFLIATHSPQVVSGLKSNNGFIVNLEKMESYSANEFNKKSADYQLAKLFDTPGYNNEYLIRIGLIILSKISKREELNIDDLNNINLLKDIKISIPENDSVYFLIEQILSLVD